MPIGQISAARRTGAALAAVFAIAGADAYAEWRFNGSASETLEVVTDREREGDDDAAFGATTTLGFSVTALDQRNQWRTDIGLTIAEFIGPGAEDDFDSIDPNFATAFQRRTRDWTFGLNGRFDIQPTSVTQLEDTGLTDEDVLQISGNVGASIAYNVTPRDSVAVSPSYQILRFDEDNQELTPSDRFSLGLTWVHAVNTDLRLTFGGSAIRLYADDLTDTVTTSADVTAGVNRSVNRRLSYNVRLGPSFTHTDRSNGGRDDFSVGATSSGGLSWLPANDLGVGLEASHALDTGSDGVLENVSRLQANMTHAFNRKTSGGVSLSYLRRTDDGQVLPVDPDLEVLTVSPTLSVGIYRDVRATAGYSLTLSREDGETATSNRFFVTVLAEF